MDKSIINKAAAIVARHTVHSGLEINVACCALGMIDLDGGPTVSAITASRAEGIRWITFCTGLASNKVIRLRKNNRASVCFCSEIYNISLTGHLELLVDQATKNEMWYPALSYQFNGPEDEAFCVLKFTTDCYNLFIDWQEVRGVL